MSFGSDKKSLKNLIIENKKEEEKINDLSFIPMRKTLKEKVYSFKIEINEEKKKQEKEKISVFQRENIKTKKLKKY